MQEAGERAGGVSVANGGSRDEHLRQDLPALTGLRFVAAFSVLIGHGFAWILADHETPGGIVFWVSQISGFGMTLFFVLSGFVIHYNYGKLVTTKRLRGVAAFLWARFARLYPLFLLMMLVYVALSSRTLALLAGNPERFGSILQALPYFLLSIHTWLYTLIGENPVIDAIGGGSPITWSISTEWFFYFAYPLVAWLILRARTPRLAAALALLWSALWIAVTVGLYDWSNAIDGWAVRHYGPIAGAQEHFQTSFVRWLLYFSPYVRLGEFLLGTLVAQLYINLERRLVSDRENLGWHSRFLCGGHLCRRDHLFELCRDCLSNERPECRRKHVLHEHSLQDEHEFRVGTDCGGADLLRSPLQKYWFARAGITPRASFGRCKLLYLSRPRRRAGNCREAHRIGKTLCCLRFG
ncbi:MAG TPA: acyltransferase, partial [Pseudolabrys sp.]|nr:acyltransferase [Pseudolabrys sp.]